MGSNDHVPVPDPKPRVSVPRPSRESAQREVMPPYTNQAKAPEPIGGPTTSSERLDALEKAQEGYPSGSLLTDRLIRLEKSRESYDLQVVGLLNHILDQGKLITEMKRLLKQTARGVERLAQGHSQGNLGLPTDEDWASYDTTL